MAFAFFTLPPEIRDLILCHAYGNKHIMTLRKEPKRWEHQPRLPSRHNGNSVSGDRKFEEEGFNRFIANINFEPTKLLLGNLMVFHQFHNEAMASLYKSSNFSFDGLATFRCFLDRLPNGRRNSIRELDLHLLDYEVDEWLKVVTENAASHLSSLRKLDMTVAVPMVPPEPDDVTVSSGPMKKTLHLPMLQVAWIEIDRDEVKPWEDAFDKDDVDEMCGNGMSWALQTRVSSRGRSRPSGGFTSILLK